MAFALHDGSVCFMVHYLEAATYGSILYKKLFLKILLYLQEENLC